MNINYYSKNYELGDEVRKYIEEKLNKFSKFSKDSISADIKIEKGKRQNSEDVFIIRVSLSIDGRDFTVEKTGSTTFESIDSAEDALENIILKDKDQRISSRRFDGTKQDNNLDSLNIE